MLVGVHVVQLKLMTNWLHSLYVFKNTAHFIEKENKQEA